MAVAVYNDLDTCPEEEIFSPGGWEKATVASEGWYADVGGFGGLSESAAAIGGALAAVVGPEPAPAPTSMDAVATTAA